MAPSTNQRLVATGSRSISILNLPATTCLEAGQVYAVIADEATSLLPLAWSSLLDEAKDIPRIWITGHDPERELSTQTKLGEEMRQALASGSLRVFQAEDNLWQDMTNRLFVELEHFGWNQGSFLVIDCAHRLFCNTDGKEVIATCCHFAKQHCCPILLLCPRFLDTVDPTPAIKSGAKQLAGFARLRRSTGELWWDIFHWFGPTGVTANQSFRLFEQVNGKLVAKDTADHTTIAPPADEALVFITRTAMLTTEQAPGTWHVTDDLNTLMTASTSLAAATVIIPSRRNAQEALRRAIHTLRHSCGARLKIIVREIDVRLRQGQEQLLLRLGANLIIPLECDFCRLQSLVGMIQGQIFSPDLETDYQATVASTMPSSDQGYLPPKDFIKSVLLAQQKTQVLPLHNALIQLPLTSELSPSEALRQCAITRHGDLCTADDNSIYLFLCACRENDIELTLERLFLLPIPDLFTGEVRYLSQETIDFALREFERRHSERAFPDLSEDLANSPAAKTPLTSPQPTSIPAPHSAPAPAVCRPLPLRQNISSVVAL
ncbi:MAG: cellulose biosynthesis protein BcsE [Desulfobulbaceae bacterium]|nr:cellulose biosynthesis protein BcsE [Desulfobulbaceae bacterium]